eukprot:COSAG02_NODE_3439_length_6743_cov_9.291541_8_plen_34_part_00
MPTCVRYTGKSSGMNGVAGPLRLPRAYVPVAIS